MQCSRIRLFLVEKRLGGRLVTVVVDGEVSAVTAAAEAGREAAAQVGKVKLCEVIPRLHEQVQPFLYTDKEVM